MKHLQERFHDLDAVRAFAMTQGVSRSVVVYPGILLRAASRPRGLIDVDLLEAVDT